MKRNNAPALKLTLFYLKRNQWKIIFWVMGLTALTLVIPPAFKNIYPDSKALVPLFEMFKSPAMEAMLGKAHLSQVNIATMFGYEMQLFTVILVAIMNILLVAKDTRGDEEDGRLEMIRALPVGRHSVIASAVFQQVMINSVLGGLIGIGLTVMSMQHFTLESNLLYGASLAAAGFMFGMLTLFVAQLSATYSQTVGISISVLLVMYLLRAMGDVSIEGISNVIPLGWIPKTAVYSSNHWWPIYALLVTAIVCLVLAVIFNYQRDAEAGMLPSRPGRAHAGMSLKTHFGLQLRLQRTGLIAWAIGLFILGLSYGSVFGDLDAFFKNNPMLKRMLTGNGTNYAEQFVPILMAIMAMVSTIPVIMAVFKIRKEIAAGRYELVLSHPVGRIRYALSFIGIGLINSVVMVNLAAVGMYVGEIASMKHPIAFDKIISAGFVYIPAILVFLGLSVCAIGWLMKYSMVVYLYLVYCFLVVYLGQLLNIKEWMKDLTPFGHVPRLPIESMHVAPLIIMMIIALASIVVGLIGFRRRDL